MAMIQDPKAKQAWIRVATRKAYGSTGDYLEVTLHREPHRKLHRKHHRKHHRKPP